MATFEIPEKLHYLSVDDTRPKFPENMPTTLKYIFHDTAYFSPLELELADAIKSGDIATSIRIIDNETFNINGQKYQHFIGAAAYGQLEIVKYMVKTGKLHAVPLSEAVKFAKQNNEQAIVEYLKGLSVD